MKKLFVVLLALAVIGVLAFADDAPAASLSVGGWGRMWVNVFGNNGTDNVVSAGPGWAGNGGRVGVSFNGNSENMGFSWNPGVSNNDMTPVCDVALIWAKINPMIKVSVGKIQGDTLRGKLDDFGDILPVDGKDNIFTRFYPNTGILVDITPMEGVYIGASIDTAPGDGTVLVNDAFKAIQIAAGYTIDKIGLVRAQYIGKGGPKAIGTDAAIQAAFAYTGMEGLLVDAGFTFPQDTNVAKSLSVAGSYSTGPISTYDRIDARFGGPSGNDGFNFDAAGQVFYTVAAPLSAGVEVAYSGMTGASTQTATALDIYPLVKLSYSNGYIKIGFDYKAGLASGMKNTYNLPIQLEYWF